MDPLGSLRDAQCDTPQRASCDALQSRDVLLRCPAQEQEQTLHEQLYAEAARRQQRLAESLARPPKEATFAPAIIVRPPDTGRLCEEEACGGKKLGLVDRRARTLPPAVRPLVAGVFAC